MDNFLHGLSINNGFVKGRCVIINKVDDLEKVNYGDILVLPNSDPIYAVSVMKASGIICENGGRLSHICVVALEMGIPCITMVKDARKILVKSEYVALDAGRGIVYYE